MVKALAPLEQDSSGAFKMLSLLAGTTSADHSLNSSQDMGQTLAERLKTKFQGEIRTKSEKELKRAISQSSIQTGPGSMLQQPQPTYLLNNLPGRRLNLKKHRQPQHGSEVGHSTTLSKHEPANSLLFRTSFGVYEHDHRTGAGHTKMAGERVSASRQGSGLSRSTNNSSAHISRGISSGQTRRFDSMNTISPRRLPAGHSGHAASMGFPPKAFQVSEAIAEHNPHTPTH